jgi:phosphoribosyl-AMP cyclohydrolase
MKNVKEEGLIVQIDFSKIKKITSPVVPVIIQNIRSKKVLLLGYTNLACLKFSLRNNLVCLWSTSRQKRWLKGQTSGDYLQLCEVRLNCEQNSLLYLVKPLGRGVCHTKVKGKTRSTCFYRQIIWRNKQLKLTKLKKKEKK